MPTPLQPTSDRFATETRFRLVVQVPENDAETLRDAARGQVPLVWGDYDHVAFESQPGRQHFRSLPGGRNAPTAAAVEVPASNSRSSCPQIRRWQPA